MPTGCDVFQCDLLALPWLLLRHVTVVCGPPRAEGDGALKAALVEAGGSEKLLIGGAKLSRAADDPEVSAQVCGALTPSYCIRAEEVSLALIPSLKAKASPLLQAQDAMFVSVLAPYQSSKCTVKSHLIQLVEE